MLRKGFLEKGHYMPSKIFLIIEKNQERREITVGKENEILFPYKQLIEKKSNPVYKAVLR